MSSRSKKTDLSVGPEEAWPRFAEDEIEAVAQVLRSGRVNQWTGDRVRAFEAAFAERIAMPHAIALANGSVALELALRAHGIGPGDDVIVTPASFVASASCVALVGAKPVFADVDENSQNISAATVEAALTPASRAVIAVHLAGWPVDMPALMALAKQRNLIVIEDCAQSVGAAIAGQPAGSFGDAAAFSFCQYKIITTGGEGGMALFRDEKAYKTAWSFKDHGKGFDRVREPSSAPGFRYVHETIGTNWRMTEMQAAIGLAQLEKLDQWLAARAANSAIWREALGQCEALHLPAPDGEVTHANYKLTVFLKPERLRAGVSRDDVLRALIDAGLRAFSGFCPEIYNEKAFADFDHAALPVAQRLGQTSLMFEIHPTLDQSALKARAARAQSVIASFQA